MKLLRKLLFGILFVAFAGGIFYGVLRLSDRYLFRTEPEKGTAPEAEANPEGKVRTGKQIDAAELNKGDTLRYTSEASVQLLNEIDIEGIAAKVLPSMVSVECVVTGQNLFGQIIEGKSAGSGIYFECKEGLLYLVTNHHVVEGSGEITVIFPDGEAYPATLKNSDELYDLAILTVKKSALKQSTLDAIVPATLAESKEVHVGEMAIAVGNALGYGTSVTVGYIGATNHRYSTDSASISLIQTDAAINPGNSGGALVNIEGEVIGINSSKLASTQVEGMGFAIPASVAIPIIKDLQEKEQVKAGEEGFLGVYITSISDDDIQNLGMPAGIFIREIIEGGAASESDLQPGDIITQVNGVPVLSSEQLQSRISSYRFGTTVTLTIERLQDGTYTEMTVDVTLKEKSLPVTDEE